MMTSTPLFLPPFTPQGYSQMVAGEVGASWRSMGGAPLVRY